MFNRKKELEAKLEKLEAENKKLQDSLKSGDFVTAEMIQRIANFNANVARTRLLSDYGTKSLEKILTDLDEIRNWRIPSNDSSWGWDYWVLLDQTTDFWIGRYSNFKGTKLYTKNAILTCLRVGIKFGVSGIEKATGIPYFVNITKEGNYLCYSATEMLDYNNEPFKKIVKEGGKHQYTVNSNIKLIKELKPKDIIIYTRRSSRIGDFTWYLKDLLTHIFNMYAIENAMIAVCPKMICNTDDPDNNAAIHNCKTLVNVRKPIKVLVTNSAFSSGSTTNNLTGKFQIAEASGYDVKGTEDMILIAKTHYEEFCNNNGIPITSSKQQSLSSDANLSTFTGQCRTKALDNHVEAFFEELGIEIQIDEPEITSQNDNADKSGGGVANTDGDKIKEGDE